MSSQLPPGVVLVSKGSGAGSHSPQLRVHSSVVAAAKLQVGMLFKWRLEGTRIVGTPVRLGYHRSEKKASGRGHPPPPERRVRFLPSDRRKMSQPNGYDSITFVSTRRWYCSTGIVPPP